MKRFAWVSAIAFALAFLSAVARASAAVPPALPAAASSFDAGSLHVDVYGAPGKPALIFIPGLTCGPWEWSGEIAAFSREYTIYALTLPGFDARAATVTPSIAAVTSDFWTMLDDRRIARPLVIGHSLGGTLGIALAEQHPERLRGVAAVDGLPIFPGFERQTPDQRAQAARQLGAAIASATTPQQFEMAQRTYSLPFLVTAQTDIDAIARLAARSDPRASAAWAVEDLTTDLRPALPKATVPLLEVAPYDPALDTRPPASFADAAAKRAYYLSLLTGAPVAQVETVAPSRHFIMYDQPAMLHSVLAAFVQAHP